MTTWTWQDYTPTPEEEEAWGLIEKEARAEAEAKEAKAQVKKTVWIGEFEFFTSYIGRDDYEFCLVHQIHEIKYCTDEQLRTIVHAEPLDWVVPDEYKGDICFSRTFMRNLGGNIKKFDREAV